MRTFYSTFWLLLLSSIAFGQVSRFIPTPAKKASTDDKRGLVSDKNFPSIYNENITYALTGEKDINTWGNFLAINVVKPTATLAFANLFHNSREKVNWILSGSATGATNGDIVSVFSGDKFGSSVELRGNAAYITRGNFPLSKFFYLKKSETELDKAVALTNDYYDYKADEITLVAKKLLATIDSINALGISANASQILRRHRAAYTLFDLQSNASSALAKARTDSIAKLERKAKWSTIRISWIDFFGSIKQQKLYLSDSTAAFTTQIKDRNFTQFRFGTAANMYFSSTYGGWNLLNGIYRIEYAYSRSNNITELDSYDVTTSASTKSTTTNQTRQISRKVSAYMSNAYLESYFHTIRFDILKQLLSNHRAYLHLVYETARASRKITEFTGDTPLPTENVKNLTVGFLISFMNKDKPKSFLNAEPYITFKDISRIYNLNPNIARGQEIGIRTTFPFGLPPTKSKNN
jgi:hypothetical protein